MNRIAINVAASTLALSIGTAVFLSNSALARPDSPRTAPAQQARQLHSQAIRSIQQGRFDEALSEIERAVEMAPRDAGYRLLLADIYLKTGRFDSARTTYADVLELDPPHIRAGLSYALMQVALGRPQAAIGQLDDLAGRAPAADVGLAYALAGMPERAIEILEPAARQHDATPRLRQNLALAFALAGNWQRARAVAAQDISPAELPRRLQQWAGLARPGGQSAQVASLLGVTPVEDSGQPVRLALIQPVVAPAANPAAEAYTRAESTSTQQVASVQPTPTAPEATIVAAEPSRTFVPTEPIETYASAEPTGAEPAWWPTPAPVTTADLSEPEIPQIPESQPVSAEELDVRFAAAAETLTRPDRAIIRNATATRPIAPIFRPQSPQTSRPTSHGRFVVQIGAFSNEGNAERAWQQAEQSYGLGRLQPTTTTINIDGRTLHRVSVSGFATSLDAGRLCASIKSRGGACFVRTNAGDAAIRWAARYAPGRNRRA
ncbi:MAG TPA: tetratricopeptide repeat protein [Allosphingosinicella sp.]|nr:tetratricopeptide repeat protein [Allosphingosinicella sp.]